MITKQEIDRRFDEKFTAELTPINEGELPGKISHLVSTNVPAIKSFIHEVVDEILKDDELERYAYVLGKTDGYNEAIDEMKENIKKI